QDHKEENDEKNDADFAGLIGSPRELRNRFRNTRQGIAQNTAAVGQNTVAVAAQADQLRQILAQLQAIRDNTDLNIDSISRDDVQRAELRDIFATINQPLAYNLGRQLVNERLDDGAYRHVERTWEGFLQKYEPKLSATVDVPKWILSFENACALYDITLEFRYKKLLQSVMSSELRSRHAAEQATIYDGIDAGAPARYQALRKWLTPISALRNAVTKAHRNIVSWTPAKKSLAENLRAYKSVSHSYRYVVRYALTHGVKRREFNYRPEGATLVQDF
ncbi:MAG: hypothetical protein GY818_15560, partial [Planctomycetaceae bacterium]|nr:hypothetical protein [Planctomycetaceae bacterium]